MTFTGHPGICTLPNVVQILYICATLRFTLRAVYVKAIHCISFYWKGSAKRIALQYAQRESICFRTDLSLSNILYRMKCWNYLPGHKSKLFLHAKFSFCLVVALYIIYLLCFVKCHFSAVRSKICHFKSMNFKAVYMTYTDLFQSTLKLNYEFALLVYTCFRCIIITCHFAH